MSMSGFTLALLISGLALYGCNDSPTSPENAGLGYFPMQVGNRWTYQAGDARWTIDVEITGKTQIGLHSYFVFEERYSSSEQVYRRFFRAGSDAKVFINWEGQDRLYVDFERASTRHGQASAIISGRFGREMLPGRFPPARLRIV